MATPRILRASAVALFAAGMVLVSAPTAANAHTGDLYTWAYTDGSEEIGGFATVSQSDAALDLLDPELLVDVTTVVGAEICAENGYAIGGDGDSGGVLTWNHTTGEYSDPVPFIADVAPWPDADSVIVVDAIELDTTADCTLLSILVVEVTQDETEGTFYTLASIDPVSGATVARAILPPPGAEGGDYRSVATDPVSGITYVFLEPDDQLPYFVTVDIETGIVSAPTELSGPVDLFESEGFTLGSDFDATGQLWMAFGVNVEEAYHLLSFAGPSAAIGTTVPADHGIINYAFEGPQVDSPAALTIDAGATVPAEDPEPTLPATGISDSGPVLLGLALFGAGMIVVAASRRSRVVA